MRLPDSKNRPTYLFFLILFLLCEVLNLTAQNLVPNPGFEMFRDLPEKNGNSINRTKTWGALTLGSDYYHRKAGRKVGVPKNIFGKQEAHSGNAYAGICIRKDWLEYLQTKLTVPLAKGEDYLIELYISRADRSLTSVKEFGLLFTEKVINIYDTKYKGMSVKPDVDFTNSKGFKNKRKWIKLSAIYKAKGNEKVLILGYFNYDKPDYKGFCHYYIDDVSITPIENKKDTIVSVKQENPTTELFSPKPGERVTLDNIFFLINESELLPESFSELDKLVRYLKENNNLIEISGHTDNTGKEGQNKILSGARAKAVADYLILKGVDKTRINYIGYGSSRPIAANNTEENKQRNRRVEFIIKPN